MKKLGIALVLTVSCAGITALAQQRGSDFQSGLNIAQGLADGGQLVLARREDQRAIPVFGFYFLVDGRLIEIEISGPEVIKNKEIKDIPDIGPVNTKLINALKVRTKTKLPNSRFVEIALDKTKGKDVVSFTLNVVQDNIYVEVRTDGGSVTLDLTSGNLIK